MKTSKIIFVSLLGAIALLILTGVIVARTAGKIAGVDLSVSKQIIPQFKVLYIKNCNIHLSYSDSSFISVKAKKDFRFSEINYKLSNDTLRISDVRYSNGNNTTVMIYSTDSLSNIDVVNSDLAIEKYGSKNLAVNSENSWVLFNQDKKEDFTFRSLSINAKKHSTINSDEFRADNLNIILEKSQSNLEIISLKINGCLSDSSTVSIKQADEISFKKDSSSRIIMYD